MTYTQFARKYNISRSDFRKWLKNYNPRTSGLPIEKYITAKTHQKCFVDLFGLEIPARKITTEVPNWMTDFVAIYRTAPKGTDPATIANRI